MWCEHKNTDTKTRMRDMITYFEGTCEFCLGNMGIDRYKNEVEELISKSDKTDEETLLLLYYVDSVIDYKVEKFADAFGKWKKAEELAIKTGNDEYLAKVYSYFSIYYYVKKENDLSKDYFEKARDIFRKNKLYSELALHYINILWYKRYEENRTEVMEYLDRALHYVQLSDAKTDARVYLHLGYIYKTIFNDFISGFKHLTMAREMCYQEGNYEMECMTFHVLADGYMQLGHYEQAVKIYRDIIDAERYRDITPNLKCMLLGNLIPAYLKIDDVKNAEIELERMDSFVPLTQVNMQKQFGGVAKWLRAQVNIAAQRNVKESLKLLEECQELYDNRGTVFPVEDFEFSLMGCFGDLFMMEGDYAKSVEYYSQQNAISDSHRKVAKMQALGKLSEAYEKMGNFYKALKYRKEKMELFEKIEQDKLLNQYDRLYKEFFREIQEKNIEKLSEDQQTLERNANIDELTGLANRGCFDEMVKEKKKNSDGGVTVFFADIDFFKKYNDCFGHTKGDECLQKVAGIINACVTGAGGKAYRYGGEEFVAVLDGKDANEGLLIAEGIVKGVEGLKRVHPASDIAPVVTVSVGVSCGDGADIERIIKEADMALYKVKNNGRNAAALYN